MKNTRSIILICIALGLLACVPVRPALEQQREEAYGPPALKIAYDKFERRITVESRRDVFRSDEHIYIWASCRREPGKPATQFKDTTSTACQLIARPRSRSEWYWLKDKRRRAILLVDGERLERPYVLSKRIDRHPEVVVHELATIVMFYPDIERISRATSPVQIRIFGSEFEMDQGRHHIAEMLKVATQPYDVLMKRAK